MSDSKRFRGFTSGEETCKGTRSGCVRPRTDEDGLLRERVGRRGGTRKMVFVRSKGRQRP